MSENQSRSSGRRRGPRHRRHQDGERPSYNKANNGNANNGGSPASEPSLFQKILAFFGFGPKKKTYPAYEGAKRTSSGSSQSSAKAPGQSAPQSTPRPTRKPEAVEVTTPKLYVGNLSFDASESDLTSLFNGVGGVRNSEIVTHRDTEKSKGFGFVTMNSIEEAKRAVTELHDKDFMGRRLVVSGAKTNDRVPAA
ncbi:MAG: RNA-binding protein [Verrucomicrobiota bacterium]